jgi:glycosyltransferase involved in cell wall biosynthesis
MADNLINTQFLPLILVGVFTLTLIVHLVFYRFFYWRLGRYRHHPADQNPQGVSVVICAHNEYHHLKESLPLILEQDYPDYEVLVVDYSSDDDTRYLLADLEEKFPHLKTISIKEELNFFSGKKFPLSIGIKSAKHDLVLLTNPECKPASKDWVRLMQSAFTPKIEVVVGYGPYLRSPGFLNKLIRFDTAHIAIQYLSYALAGVPYMGVGRNLSYRKQVFYKNNGFISHYRIHSGDDNLFVNRVASKSNTAIMVDPGSHTLSDPEQALGSWITQKKKHLSTSHLYRFNHKFLLGLYSFNLVLFYGLFILLLSLNWSVIPVVGIFIIRLVFQYIVFARCLKQLNEKDLVPFLLFFEILLLLFNAATWFSNVFHKPTRWK